MEPYTTLLFHIASIEPIIFTLLSSWLFCFFFVLGGLLKDRVAFQSPTTRHSSSTPLMSIARPL